MFILCQTATHAFGLAVPRPIIADVYFVSNRNPHISHCFLRFIIADVYFVSNRNPVANMAIGRNIIADVYFVSNRNNRRTSI